MNRRLVTFSLVCVIVFQVPVAACLWDRDTLSQERARFPTTLELVAGHFLRHSDDFYRWRVEDCTAKLEKDSKQLELYDDLAVAYDKLGDHERAIEVILEKESLSPGLYETAANLGTFHIHAGNLEEGLKHIKRAIEINPEAHFGREIYQQLLVEYLILRRSEQEAELPLSSENRAYGSDVSFARFVLETRLEPESDAEARQQEVDAALRGVLGMMRFGNHDSPVLLEAAGDLLLARGYPKDGRRLACRAYLRASYQTDGAASEAYRKLAESALFLQLDPETGSESIKLGTIEARFKGELADAEAWFSDLKSKERQWIATSADPEAEYAKEYSVEPTVAEGGTGENIGLVDRLGFPLTVSLAGLMFVVVVAVVARRFFGGFA